MGVESKHLNLDGKIAVVTGGNAFLVQATKEYPKAAAYLETWRKVVRAAAWQSLLDVRRARVPKGLPSLPLIVGATAQVSVSLGGFSLQSQ